MDAEKGTFTVKLYELEQRYAQLRSKILMYQQANHKEIRTELRRIRDIFQEDELKLQKSIRYCRSPAVAALSGAQREYIGKARDILERYIERYQCGLEPGDRENGAEAMALYAEYAIDFAVQAINHAQFAALSAIDLQMTVEEAARGE